MDYQKIAENLIEDILDCIEACVDTIVVKGGKQLILTTIVCYIFLIASIVSYFTGIWSLSISWVTALIASITMTIILIVNQVSRYGVDKTVKKVKEVFKR